MSRPDSTAVMARRHVAPGATPLLDHGGGAAVLIPHGHTAVMAHRAATKPDGLDFFPTPPWAARAGGELIQSIDPGAWSCWEPAAGGGHMAHGLRDYFAAVLETDVFPHGQNIERVVDFTATEGDGLSADWIVTNPPFKLGEAFIRRALDRAQRGVAMLLRLAFLESVGRFPLFYGAQPLTIAAPFAERVPMVEGRWDPEASSATAYCWFIWRKGASGPPVLSGIAPGTRDRLSRAEDLIRFHGASETPLFAESAA